MLPPGTLTATAVRQRPSELTVPRLPPPALATPDALEQVCTICGPVDSPGMRSALPETEQPSESLAHRPARCCVDERLSPGPALRSIVTLLRKLPYVPRSCQYRSTNIDYVSNFRYMLSDIFDTLSILIDTETFCGSIPPGKGPLQYADYRRL